MHRENVQTRTSFNNYGIAQRLRPCNLHSPLSLSINAIVDDHIAVAVALVFAKLSNVGGGGGMCLLGKCCSCPLLSIKYTHFGR